MREYNIGDEDGYETRLTYATIRSGRLNRGKHSTKMAHMARRLLDVFLVATGITDKKKKRALLLYQADPKIEKCFDKYRKMETMTTSIKRQILKRTFRTTNKNRLYDV